MIKWVRLVGPVQRAYAKRLVDEVEQGWLVQFAAPTRSVRQNALLWSLLSSVSQAKPDEREHSPEIWKCLFMQACGHAVQFEVGLDGHPFPLGFRSSKLTKEQMTDLIEFILEYCGGKGIKVLIDEGWDERAV